MKLVRKQVRRENTQSNYWIIIMANGWTDERRARQAALIHNWKPWKHSTGARSAAGRAVSSRNAFRFTQRKAWLFACWLSVEAKKCRTGKPFASIAECLRHEALRGFSFRAVSTQQRNRGSLTQQGIERKCEKNN